MELGGREGVGCLEAPKVRGGGSEAWGARWRQSGSSCWATGDFQGAVATGHKHSKGSDSETGGLGER